MYLLAMAEFFWIKKFLKAETISAHVFSNFVFENKKNKNIRQ